MIVSFGDDDTEELFRTESNRRFSQIARVALRKLIADRSDLTEPDLLSLIRTDIPSPERLKEFLERLKPVRPPSPAASPGRNLLNGRLSSTSSSWLLRIRCSKGKMHFLMPMAR